MQQYVRVSDSLEVQRCLQDTLERHVLSGLPETVITRERFWLAFDRLLSEFYDENLSLLRTRDELQRKIDECPDKVPSEKFLREIGYLVEDKGSFRVETKGVDAELREINSPQLVVPLDNERYALNAANARWGSLAFALYQTDAIEAPTTSQVYDPARGLIVFGRAFEYLDEFVPLSRGSWSSVVSIGVEYSLNGDSSDELVFTLKGDEKSRVFLKDRENFKGSSFNANKYDRGEFEYYLVHNDLHIILVINKNRTGGKQSPFGLADIILESCCTAILDMEDSVSVVDGQDKAHIYENWSSMMKRNLQVDMGGGRIRTLKPERIFRLAKDGSTGRLPGTATLLIRNVGIMMFSDACKWNGKPVPEGLLDLAFTSVAALHDILGHHGNSKTGSMYIVKPKMHGPAEVDFVNRTFGRWEELAGLPHKCIKVGMMDEERRTSANLKECIRAVKDRIFFINTGFLDRTGDEIHTSFTKGVIMPKDTIKKSAFIPAYEKRNVWIGLTTGLHLCGQIGKGMWAEPDSMRAMLAQKIGQPMAGASTAWVPSPAAGTLHVLHYHMVDVKRRQAEILLECRYAQDNDFQLAELLQPPYAADGGAKFSREEIRREVQNNVQGLLGYVVKWVQLGVGCSKIKDIEGKGLMEDRATLRISSQHVANWLHFKLITEEELKALFDEMSVLVNEQNKNTRGYHKLDDKCPSYQAAMELVMEGRQTKNGYTEEILSKYRLMQKADDSARRASL
mmetsp:Transcript_10634/g.30109  ORF Transcript_10634/g.30109 Transcript_10634/m.30109 type:complete len:737 (+) Transcript_10634:91-2301(+)